MLISLGTKFMDTIYKGNRDMNYIEVMKDFVEGRLEVSEFASLVEANSDFRKELENGLPAKRKRSYSIYLKNFNYNITDYIVCKKNAKSVTGRSLIHSMIVTYLEIHNIAVIPTEKYSEEFRFLLSVQPQYLYSCNGREEECIDEIIQSMPDGLSKTKKIQYCKEKIKELFRWEKSRPQWLQNCEWPFASNGKPMVFKEQKKKKEGDFLKYFYYFYDPETGETAVVEQYD